MLLTLVSQYVDMPITWMSWITWDSYQNCTSEFTFNTKNHGKLTALLTDINNMIIYLLQIPDILYNCNRF